MTEQFGGNVKKFQRKAGGGFNTSVLSELGKIPPQAVDMEEVVLGALMLERDAISVVIEILQGESFYKDEHKEIYTAIRALFEKSQPIDILTVTNELRQKGKLDFVGGAFYISELTNRVSSAANIEYHARIIAQKHILRRLIEVCSKIQTDAYEETSDVFDLLDMAEKELFSITEQNLRSSYDNMSQLISKALTQMEEMRNNSEGLSGIPSGFTGLDRITSGWQRSDLIILAARPGMGKCLGKGTKVLMFDGSLKKVEDVVIGDQLMGDDSTPRNVLSIARGRENMYWIRQNKGKDYRVNESHILSLKRSRNEGGYKHGDVLNIEVKDYLAKSDKFKSNYKGYKVAVEWPEKELSVDPYFLGLWLGDGASASCRITTQDQEVIDYLANYAETLDLQLTEEVYENRCNTYGITKGYRGGNIATFSLQDELRQLDVIKNKHIPQQYLINSTENRLQLLAGLIDSDGHYDAQANGYEITQKNKELAKQIKFLCDSLGFRTSLKKKRASISSTGYEAEVYRVRIFGDIEKVPVKIPRKKANPRTSKADWKMTGIKVEFDKEDDYYGFEIDGNHLFLLEDMTVTHNTAFVLALARNASVTFKKPVAVFSLEMSSLQLVLRLISSEAEINSMKLKTGDLEDHEWHQLHTKIAKLSQAPLYIDDTPALNVFELRAKCRRLKAQHGIDMIIIDYLQLMAAGKEGKSSLNREQEISTISRALKQLAKELNVPVIALSQLSRAVEQRGGTKKPLLSDLRESGSIEQDADQVLFIYRPEYYGLTEDEEGRPTNGLAEIIIAKNRHGALESVPLRFIDKFARFADMDEFSFQATDSSFPPSAMGGGAMGGFGGGGDDHPGPNFSSITRGSRMNEDLNDEEAPF